MVALVLTEKALSYAKQLSVKLQGHYVDVVCAHNNIKTTLAKLRSDVESLHRVAYEALLLCQKCRY